MIVYLIAVAVIIIVCVIFNKVSSKLGVPMLLAFMLLGIFFGSDGIVKIPFDNYDIAAKVCSVALIFIMFYGGFGTKWSEAMGIKRDLEQRSPLQRIQDRSLLSALRHPAFFP